MSTRADRATDREGVWSRAPDDAERGAIRYRSFAFKGVEWLMFVEVESGSFRKWWRPLTPAETMNLIVEEDL